MPKQRFIPHFLIPKPLRSGSVYRGSFQLAMNMLKQYGWFKSMRENKCIDREGNPIPWITYPAIDFLSQLDYTERSVFEYGSGFSTLFWAPRAKNVIAVETDLEWYKKSNLKLHPIAKYYIPLMTLQSFQTKYLTSENLMLLQ